MGTLRILLSLKDVVSRMHHLPRVVVRDEGARFASYFWVLLTCLDYYFGSIACGSQALDVQGCSQVDAVLACLRRRESVARIARPQILVYFSLSLSLYIYIYIYAYYLNALWS